MDLPCPPVSTTSGERLAEKRGSCVIICEGSYDPNASHYPRVCNASQHPVVAQFMSMSRSAMIARYCTLHPEVAEGDLSAVLRKQPAHFKWAGCDLFVTGPSRRVCVVETNSCPSGQKSLPYADGDPLNGYGRLMRTAFASLLCDGLGGSGGSSDGAPRDAGVLAVLYDKNAMEARGYAGALAELSQEAVYLAESYLTDPDPPLRWDAARRLHVRSPDGAWLPVRAALRYVTQKPWTRMPVVPATALLNSLLPCLAGGRNKMLAARAYDALNARLAREGNALRLLTPATVGDVRKSDVPGLVARMGGCAVVKVPYGNAGQGVYTITSPAELDTFMGERHGYDKFIVQQLVGGRRWGAAAVSGSCCGVAAQAALGEGASGAAVGAAAEAPSFERLYHIGTVPNNRGKSFVFDLRMMVVADEGGFKPCSMYARRAAVALSELPPTAEPPEGPSGTRSRLSSSSFCSADSAAFAPPPAPLHGGGSRSSVGGGSASVPPSLAAKALSPSWLQLGTNLSVLTGDLTWSTESERLLMMDARDFATLGLGLDDLIDAFVQSVLAVTAIDEQAAALLDEGGQFDLAKFAAVNDDPALIAELMPVGPGGEGSGGDSSVGR